jgi:predicted metal-binding membrane protein
VPRLPGAFKPAGDTLRTKPQLPLFGVPARPRGRSTRLLSEPRLTPIGRGATVRCVSAFAQAPGGQARRVDALQAGAIAGLFVLAALAWVLTVRAARGMDMGPGGSLGSLSFFLGTWVAMMAAMMFPSIVPMVRGYAILDRGHGRRGLGEPSAEIAVFVAGYLLAWTAFGLAAYAVIDLVRALDVQLLSWEEGGRYLAGGVVLAAAVYQLTPLKDACLSCCRDPLDFLAKRWRDGAGGALGLGLRHGARCVGCCWALMAALFALGVMSIGWMVFVAALIAAEKLLPWRAAANRGIAVLLVVLGLSVALAPERVPGLVVPDSSGAMQGMEAMEGR